MLLQKTLKLSTEQFNKGVQELFTNPKFRRFVKLVSDNFDESIDGYILSSKLDKTKTLNFRKLFVPQSGKNIILYSYDSIYMNAMTFPTVTDGINIVEEYKKELKKSNNNIITMSNSKLQNIKNFVNIKKINDREYKIHPNNLIELFFNYPIPILYSIANNKVLKEEEHIALFLHEVGHHIIEPKVNRNFLAIFFRVVGYLAFIGRFLTVFFPPVYLIFFCISLLILIPNNMIDRSLEYASDSFAAIAGYGDALISSLQKLTDNYEKQITALNIFDKFIINIQDFFNKYFNLGTHPTLEKREKNIKKTMEENTTLDQITINKVLDMSVEKITTLLEYALS